MSAAPVFVLGGFQTDFARHFAREQKDIADIVQESVAGVLQATDLNPNAIESIHVGNAFGELFNGQSQLGAMVASVDPRFVGIPAMRHEAACASGSLAILAAMAEIEAGRYDCVLVLGAEQERNVTGAQAAAHMAAASWRTREGEGCTYLWPAMFSQVADEYQRRYGLQYAHLGAIAANNIANAKRNPNAQTRNWQFQPDSFTQNDELNPVIEGWTRRQDCGQVSDGGAAVVLASSRFAHVWANGRGKQLAKLPRILGWGHRTAGLALQSKFGPDDGLCFPHLRRAILDAFARSSVADASQLHGIETHDCFAMTQYMAIDHFGITPPGQSWRAIESGELAFDGKLPINPSGGLIGGGHPVGASGVRMLWDAAKQVSGTAGDYQVAGAKRFATLNIGGSATTVVSFVVGV
jgi:acetyl-CoA C-acetyltransferase